MRNLISILSLLTLLSQGHFGGAQECPTYPYFKFDTSSSIPPKTISILFDRTTSVSLKLFGDATSKPDYLYAGGNEGSETFMLISPKADSRSASGIVVYNSFAYTIKQGCARGLFTLAKYGPVNTKTSVTSFTRSKRQLGCGVLNTLYDYSLFGFSGLTSVSGCQSSCETVPTCIGTNFFTEGNACIQNRFSSFPFSAAVSGPADIDVCAIVPVPSSGNSRFLNFEVMFILFGQPNFNSCQTYCQINAGYGCARWLYLFNNICVFYRADFTYAEFFISKTKP